MSGMKKPGGPQDPNEPPPQGAPPPQETQPAQPAAPGGYGGVPGLRPPPAEGQGPTMGRIPEGQPVRRPGDPGTYTTTMEEQPRTTTEQPHQWDQQPPPQQAQPRRFQPGAQGQYGGAMVPPNPNPGAAMGRKPMPMVPQQGKGMRTA